MIQQYLSKFSSHRTHGDRQYFQRFYLKVDTKHLVITNFMVLITNFAQEIPYELLRNTTSMIFYNSLIIKVFWPMHFFRLNILESLFSCNVCFIQSDYSISFFLVENNSQNWNFAFLLKPTLSQVMAIWNRNKHSSIINRVLLRFEFHVPHQILYTTLATDEKWPS